MSRRRLILFLLLFALLISLYYYAVKPLLHTGENALYQDDFSTLNSDFWYVGSMQTDAEIKSQAKLDGGALILEKTARGEDLYFLTRPLKMSKRQILTVRRKLNVHPGKDYFSGGLVLYQTDSVKRFINPSDEMPFGKPLLMVEYVKDPTGKSKRPGKNNIRILPPNWKEDESAVLMKSIFDRDFEEELTYHADTGLIEYRAGGAKETLQGEPLKNKNIRVWMHAYGNSAKQRIRVDEMEIEVRNIEDSNLEN
ncbi:MAG: hypothetical protein Q4A72_03980 [Bacillota bacterium]|nr:hypothetical protein [Bacillota bacterium]